MHSALREINCNRRLHITPSTRREVETPRPASRVLCDILVTHVTLLVTLNVTQANQIDLKMSSQTVLLAESNVHTELSRYLKFQNQHMPGDMSVQVPIRSWLKSVAIILQLWATFGCNYFIIIQATFGCLDAQRRLNDLIIIVNVNVMRFNVDWNAVHVNVIATHIGMRLKVAWNAV